MKVYVDELWKDIFGYENIYQISSYGNVRKIINKNNDIQYQMLKPLKRTHYLSVHLYKNHIRKVFDIHRLVAKAFIPNPENKPCVNHKDCNKLNNNVNNLEWVTLKENSQHSVKNKRVKLRPIIQYTKQGVKIKEWKSIKEAGEIYGYANNICHCCLNKQKTAYGYIWRYKIQAGLVEKVGE